MFAKLLSAYLALLVATLAVFGILSAQGTKERILAESELRLKSRIEMLRPIAVRIPEPRELQATVQELGRRIDARLSVIAPDGRVLADSHANPAAMENHNSRPEVQEARARGSGRNVHFSHTVQYDMMYLASPLDSKHPEGIVLRSALPLTSIRDEESAVYRAMAYMFLAVGLAGAVLTYLLTRWITRPLRKMQSVAQAIAAGDFSQRAPLDVSGEIGKLARAVNRMAEELSLRLSALKAESSKLETLIAGMQEGVIAVDSSGQVIHHNASIKSLLDIRVDPRGLKIWDAARAAGIEEIVRKALKDAAPVQTVIEIGSRSVQMSVRPIEGLHGAVLVARDATEERRYDALRKEFVANVSHELRTPLGIIQGYIETLRDGAWKDPQRGPEFLDIADRQIRRLAALVDDLLQLSRLEAAGPALRPADVPLKPFLEKIRDQFRPLADKKHQSLAVGPVEGSVHADPDLLDRAVGNLVDNAIKYTQEGGRVTLKAVLEATGAALSVEDNGPGIPEADHARIFERFYRVEKSRSRELGGTGLGLAIVKHVAQLHGGTVDVRNAPGAGSLFTLRIPRRTV